MMAAACMTAAPPRVAEGCRRAEALILPHWSQASALLVPTSDGYAFPVKD